MYPNINYKFPIEILFKMLKTNEKMPLIKLNPGNRKEKMYRLYTNKIAINGNKIPFLNKAKIFKLQKTLAKTKSISCYINPEPNIEIICTFKENGSVSIEFFNYEIPISISLIEKYIFDNVNPILYNVKNFMELSGYTFKVFESIYNYNVEINDMLYQINTEITKKFDISKFIGCLNDVFNIENNDLSKGIILRFKRVSNFNEMDSQEAFIVVQYTQKKTYDEIISLLQQNFTLSKENAVKKLGSFLNDVQIELSLNEAKKLKIKSNPGFEILIKKEQFTNNINIYVTHIDNINYIKTLPIYLDTLIRLTQDIESTNVDNKIINEMCQDKIETLKDKKYDIPIKDKKPIIAPVVQDDDSDLLDLMFDNDDEEDDDDEDDDDEDDDDEDNDDEDDDEDDDVLSLKSLNIDYDIDEDDDAKDGDAKDDDAKDGDAKDDDAKDDDAEQEISSLKSLNISDDEDDLESVSSDKFSTISPLESVQSLSKIDDLSSPATPIPPEISKLSKSKGGGPKKESENELDKDLTNMKLSNPNPFEAKMQKLDPKLFLTKKQGKYAQYSRLCPSNWRRQPVILTDDEKNEIDKKHPGSYTEAMKYGSSKDNEHWYICPRYWSLKDNTSLSEEEVVKGNLKEKIIPFGAKKIPKGAYIYEFKGREGPTVDKDGNYSPMYPGFTKDDSHPDGLCVPCCFKSWDSESQKKRREECLNKEDKKKPAKKILKIKKILDEREYIKGPEKMPLDFDRWGYLPVTLEKFFSFNSKNCQENSNTIKQFKTCILRKGVQFSKNQSFISCICDLYSEYINYIPSISDMKEIIIKSINIDNFIYFQNGNLVSVFIDNDGPADIELFKDTNLYAKLDLTKESNLLFFKRIIQSYNNFINYLMDDNEIIDYTYLWEIICEPNPKLFKNGLNLVILESINNDITDNIGLICPTNYYNNKPYKVLSQTLFLYKNENFYEPIYTYTDNDREVDVKKAFSEHDQYILPNIKRALLFVKELYSTRCKPLPSKPETVYQFKRNIVLKDMIKILTKLKYIISYQVINYSNKVIGLIVNNEKGAEGYIPCYPSAINLELTYKFMDAEDLWKDYDNTVDFLKKLNVDSNGQIPCKPIKKVIEDGFIVGVLTETNQFVMINSPTENIYDDDLEQIDDKNHLLVDNNVLVNNNVDKERIFITKKIKLESQFYTAFRTTIKTIFNNPLNTNYKKLVENIIESSDLYTEKLIKIIDILIKISSDYVSFVETYNDDLINIIEKITTCINNENCQENKFCLTSKDKCVILIPKQHLVNKTDNKKIYYGRIADELVRYNNIRNYILKPQMYMSFSSINYNLSENEIILLDSLLTQEFFENLIPKEINKYAKNTVFDDIQPNTSLPYDNKEVIIKEFNKSDDCIIKTTSKIRGKWAIIFPEKCYEKVYKNSELCTFKIIINIIKDYLDSDVTINEIKLKLIEEYTKYFKNDNINIMLILIEQGKNNLIKMASRNEINLQDLITSSNYYLTNLDLWVLAKAYNLPIIILAGTKLTENNRSLIVLNDVDINSYYFIRQPGIKRNVIPEYSIIFQEDKAMININLMKKIRNIVNIEKELMTQSDLTVQNYINNFMPKATKIKRIKKPKL
tara:strand:+ start:7 stop:4815 length:4809 start_codon:yes stop_codon:yes gene_type:complete